MDAAIDEAFAKLKLLKAFDFYKTRAFTPEQEAWVQLVCDRYLQVPLQQRESIRSLITPQISFVFFLYARVMAERAVRERHEANVFKGLIALSVENQVFDWRDSTIVLVQLHHSALKIGADPLRLLKQAAEISSSRTSKLFLGFATRTSENLDLAKFGLKEGTDSDGNFAYVPK